MKAFSTCALLGVFFATFGYLLFGEEIQTTVQDLRARHAEPVCKVERESLNVSKYNREFYKCLEHSRKQTFAVEGCELFARNMSR